MSYPARRELLAHVAGRYREANHAQRTSILDEFVAATGYARKYAIRLLTQPVVPLAAPVQFNEEWLDQDRINGKVAAEEVRMAAERLIGGGTDERLISIEEIRRSIDHHGTPPTFLVHSDRREPASAAGHLLRVYPPLTP